MSRMIEKGRLCRLASQSVLMGLLLASNPFSASQANAVLWCAARLLERPDLASFQESVRGALHDTQLLSRSSAAGGEDYPSFPN